METTQEQKFEVFEGGMAARLTQILEQVPPYAILRDMALMCDGLARANFRQPIGETYAKDARTLRRIADEMENG